MKSQPLTATDKLNLGGAVYRRISDDLIKGRLRPNDKITIRGLADSFGVSSTPVRDAIMRLIQDGALEQRTARDVRVPIITVERYLEIARIRMELEGFVAAEAATMATEKDLAYLDNLLAKNERSIDRKNWALSTEHNQRFHFFLPEITKMPVLNALLGNLWLQMGPLIAGYYASGGRDMIDYHYKVVKALKNREPEAARRSIVADIKGSISGISNHILAYDGGG